MNYQDVGLEFAKLTHRGNEYLKERSGEDEVRGSAKS